MHKASTRGDKGELRICMKHHQWPQNAGSNTNILHGTVCSYLYFSIYGFCPFKESVDGYSTHDYLGRALTF